MKFININGFYIFSHEVNFIFRTSHLVDLLNHITFFLILSCFLYKPSESWKFSSIWTLLRDFYGLVSNTNWEFFFGFAKWTGPIIWMWKLWQYIFYKNSNIWMSVVIDLWETRNWRQTDYGLFSIDFTAKLKGQLKNNQFNSALHAVEYAVRCSSNRSKGIYMYSW